MNRVTRLEMSQENFHMTGQMNTYMNQLLFEMPLESSEIRISLLEYFYWLARAIIRGEYFFWPFVELWYNTSWSWILQPIRGVGHIKTAFSMSITPTRASLGMSPRPADINAAVYMLEGYLRVFLPCFVGGAW
jgi:hypothetical protein